MNAKLISVRTKYDNLDRSSDRDNSFLRTPTRRSHQFAEIQKMRFVRASLQPGLGPPNEQIRLIAISSTYPFAFTVIRPFTAYARPMTRLTTMAATPASTAFASGDVRMLVIALDPAACCGV